MNSSNAFDVLNKKVLNYQTKVIESVNLQKHSDDV